MQAATRREDEMMELLRSIDEKLNVLIRLQGTIPPGYPSVSAANWSEFFQPTRDLTVNDNLGNEAAELLFWRQFTPRQHAIIQMMISGSSPEDIAERLAISKNTAKTHIAHIARKLGVDTKSMAISKLSAAMQRIDDKSYQMASGGIAKDWHVTYQAGDAISFLDEKEARMRGTKK